MRSMRELDLFRSKWYPDDVCVYLVSKDMSPELVWASALRVVDGALEAMLLNEPEQDFSVHVGDTLRIHFMELEKTRAILVAEC